jgi:membrane protein involved in colicin uptake
MPETETPIDDVTPEEVPDETTDTETHAEHDELGDTGKRALEAERKARRAAERAAKAAQAELDKAREASLSESERLVAQAKREAREELQAEYATRVIRAEVKAAATGRLSDVNDALVFLDLNGFEVDDDGNVDNKAVTKAIDELIKSKPYLAAHRVGGDVDGGARGKPTTTSGDMNSLIRQAAGLS